MEKPNAVRYGGMKLPLGFRFHPTDEELLVHYLKRKAYSLPLPASVISDLDVFHTHPSHLPGDWKERRYFFSKRKGNMKKCSRISTTSGCGYWKVIGNDKEIVSAESKKAVGVKKPLVFYQGKRPHGLRTRWFMNQYSLMASPTTPHSTHNCTTEMEDWVVCRISQKKNKAKNRGVQTQQYCIKTKDTEVIRQPSSVMDLMMEDTSDLGPPPPSSPSSTSTGITCDELDQEACSAYLT